MTKAYRPFPVIKGIPSGLIKMGNCHHRDDMANIAESVIKMI